MQDNKWLDKEIKDVEMSMVYKDFPGHWLLFEVLSTNESMRPVLFRLVFWSMNKEDIHDMMMENEDWDTAKKHILLFADPEKPCDLG